MTQSGISRSQLKPVKDLDLSPDEKLQRMDERVDHAEDNGIGARWEFGREVLSRRVGKKLPEGELDRIATLIGKSREEVQLRVRFAERFPSEELLRNAVTQYGSWHGIVNKALSSTAHLSTEKDEWATPQDLFDELEEEFQFTIDVCATPANAKCKRFYSLEQDALAEDWAGEIAFMNPPYSEIETWMAKAYEEGRNGATVVCLVPSRTDVEWSWEFARRGEVRLLKGRLSFVDDEGNTGPAPFPSLVVVFGPGRRSRVVWHDRP